jgi:ABC-type sulfate transport system permease subunit
MMSVLAPVSRMAGLAPAARAADLTEPALVRWTLTALALGFLALFLGLPLLAVMVEALRDGVAAYTTAMLDPEFGAALRLTLLTVAIAVPANLVSAWRRHGLSRDSVSRAVASQHPHRSPFAVSPVIAGLVFVLHRGAEVSGRGSPATICRSSSPCPASSWPRCSCRRRTSSARSSR